MADYLTWQMLVLFIAGIWAGGQNALAGGGSFVTLPALMLTGLNPLQANITSTMALFPAQTLTGYAGRSMVSGIGELSFKALFIISLIGGVVGAFLLLHTPSKIFASLVPWLVLFATVVFAWGNFFRKPPREGEPPHMGKNGMMFTQFCIAIYGGYFGGGIGFLMLAALTLAGMSTRYAASTKNVLNAVMNAAAFCVFLLSPEVSWVRMLILSAGAMIGGWLGALALKRVNEKALKIAVVCIGIALTIGLFVKPL